MTRKRKSPSSTDVEDSLNGKLHRMGRYKWIVHFAPKEKLNEAEEKRRLTMMKPELHPNKCFTIYHIQ
jgi:hypothetical protein